MKNKKDRWFVNFRKFAHTHFTHFAWKQEDQQQQQQLKTKD